MKSHAKGSCACWLWRFVRRVWDNPSMPAEYWNLKRREETMHTDPDGKPYAHNAEQAEAHKLALAEGDGPVSNETARAYLNAYPSLPRIEIQRRDGTWSLSEMNHANERELYRYAAAIGRWIGNQRGNVSAVRISPNVQDEPRPLGAVDDEPMAGDHIAFHARRLLAKHTPPVAPRGAGEK